MAELGDIFTFDFLSEEQADWWLKNVDKYIADDGWKQEARAEILRKALAYQRYIDGVEPEED